MSEQGQERTEQPTDKRLREARERGQVARSRELSAAAVIGASALALALFGGAMAQASAEFLREALTIDAAVLETPALMPARFGEAMVQGLKVSAPLLLACFVGAVVAGVGMGGWNFSGKALAPDFSRLNPVTGLARLFSLPALVELVKALLKVIGIGACVWFALQSLESDLVGLAAEPSAAGIAHSAQLSASILGLLAGILLLIAGIDVPYQWFKHRSDLMMTRQELLDEMKESDGRPEVKGRIRRLQQEMSQRRMMEAVATADVVVTNPTHYAVALSYSQGAMRAPRVVAKGADLIAAAIRERAARHSVPLVEAPPLARALYRSVDIGREIPANLYNAVAQILTYVYQLRAFRAHGGRAPSLPVIDPGVEEAK